MGTQLAALVVTDTNYVGSAGLVYAVESVSPSAVGVFSVTSTSSGVSLVLAGSLDYETTTRYTVVVNATDAGNPPDGPPLTGRATVVVVVGDVNDVAPTLQQASYTTFFTRSAAPAELSLQVRL